MAVDEEQSSLAQLSEACAALSRLIKSIDDAPPEILSLSNEFSNLQLLILTISSSRNASIASQVNGVQLPHQNEITSTLQSDASAWTDHMALVKHLEWSYCVVGFESRRRRWIRDRRSVLTAVDFVQVKILTVKADISAALHILHRTELRLDNIDACDEYIDDLQLALRTCTYGDHITDVAGLFKPSPSQSRSAHDGPRHHTHDDRLKPCLKESIDSASQDSEYFSVNVTAYAAQTCSSGCKCACHTWYIKKEHPIFTCVMGALLFSYCKSPIAYSKCSDPACRAACPVLGSVTYFLPPQIIRMLVSLFYMPNSPGRPSMGLIVPQLVSVLSEEIRLAMRGDVKGMQSVLSARKGNLNVANEQGQSPLHYAAWEGKLEMAKLLMSQGADPYQRDNNNICPMTIARTRVLGNSLSPTTSSGFRTLFATPTWIEEANFTTLHKIVLGLSHKDLATELSSHTPNSPSYIDAPASCGTTPLSLAALRANPTHIKLLLAAGANPYAQSNHGLTPLKFACLASNSAGLITLLEAGIDPNYSPEPKYKRGDTGTSTIEVEKKESAEHRYGYTALIVAAGTECPVEYIKLLLQAGAEVNARASSNYSTAIFCAARLGSTATVRALLEAGAHPDVVANIPTSKSAGDGMRPLEVALLGGYHEIVRDLLAWGAEGMFQCGGVVGKGGTVLHLVASRGDLDMVEVMREAAIGAQMGTGMDLGKKSGLWGLNVNAVDVDGRTAQRVFDARATRDGEDGVLREAFQGLLFAIVISNGIPWSEGASGEMGLDTVDWGLVDLEH